MTAPEARKVTEEDDDTTSGSKRRFTDADFETARELYELGKAGIAELALDFGVSRQTLSKRLKDAGAIKGSRAHEVGAAAGAAAKATVERFADRRAEWIEETRLQGLAALKQARLIGQKIVVDTVKAGNSLATVDDDLKALGRFNKILIDNIGKSLEVLRADEHIDEDDLPILTIEDLTDEDILNHHKSTGALDEDATIEDLNLHEVEYPDG